MTRIDETGKRYARLIVLHEFAETNRRDARWMCRCDCGTQPIVRGDNLRRGATLSCGCLRNDKTLGAFLKTVRKNALDRFDEDIL